MEGYNATMVAQPAIEISDVHKRYGSLQVLRGVDLTVAQGEAFGLLGPNGAGKSTLTHLILGLLFPDRGEVRVFGRREIERIIPRVGYLPERPRYHTQLTAREYLMTLGRLSDMEANKLHDRVDHVVELVGIQDAADRRIGTYSKGMLQRLGLAQALLHEPELLIADEPASGLDPEGQSDMAALLQQVRSAGHTLFLCTHQLTEVARLCDRVGVLVNGRLDPVTSLVDLQAQGHSVTIKVRDLPAETAGILRDLSPNVRATRAEVVLFPSSDALQAQVLRTLLDDQVTIMAVTPEADALEQFYLRAIHAGNASPTDDPPSIEGKDPLIDVLVNEEAQ
jgi:ABC-2 type transport system ATP-binding protein